MRASKIVILLGILFIATGCANLKPMALSGQESTLDLTTESVAVFTLKTTNELKPDYQPNVTAIRVATKQGDNEEKYSFQPGVPYKKMENQFNEYLVSMKLKPGKYKLQDIFGMSTGFMINGHFSIPVHTDFEMAAGKVVYLGRIEAVNRLRKLDSEPRAGSVIPLIDQRVTGYAGGTFDVTISDNFEHDMASFKQLYPVMGNVNVEKAILPAWTKRTADELASIQ